MLEAFLIAYIIIENVIQYSLNIHHLIQIFCPRDVIEEVENEVIETVIIPRIDDFFHQDKYHQEEEDNELFITPPESPIIKEMKNINI